MLSTYRRWATRRRGRRRRRRRRGDHREHPSSRLSAYAQHDANIFHILHGPSCGRRGWRARHRAKSCQQLKICCAYARQMLTRRRWNWCPCWAAKAASLALFSFDQHMRNKCRTCVTHARCSNMVARPPMGPLSGPTLRICLASSKCRKYAWHMLTPARGQNCRGANRPTRRI